MFPNFLCCYFFHFLMSSGDDTPTPAFKTPMDGGPNAFRAVQRFRSLPIPGTIALALRVCLALKLRSTHVTMVPAAACYPVDEGHLRPGNSSPEPLAWRAHEALQHRNMTCTDAFLFHGPAAAILPFPKPK